MEKILYHGSDHIIEKPEFGKGKTHNDYGMGFYCTESLEMAKEWGTNKNRIGYANKYRIDCDGLKILNLNTRAYTMLHWLTVLLENRTFDTTSPLAAEAKEYLLNVFHTEYEAYDVIVGYRADDSYFSFASDFINGTISYRQLCNAMKLGKLGEQVVIKSQKAFGRLEFLSAEIAEPKEWYTKKFVRDNSARQQYFDLRKNKRVKGDLYITAILDEEMKPDDQRLR